MGLKYWKMQVMKNWFIIYPPKTCNTLIILLLYFTTHAKYNSSIPYLAFDPESLIMVHITQK